MTNVNLFKGENNFDHARMPTTGVLLVNMGTPDAPTAAALRPYLAEFLWDPRVIEEPRLKWWLILNGIILRTRPRRSAKLYQKVWTNEGSPLLVYSKRQARGLQTVLQQRLGSPVEVALGMRYGNPSIPSALAQLKKLGARKVLVLPLYPQYSGTTTASGFDAIVDELKTWRWIPELRFVNNYHDDAGYINCLAESIEKKWDVEGEPEKLLLSFHGIPKRYLMNGDPYHCQCLKTGRLISEKLGLTPDRYTVTFQSLFGKEEWIKPYTSDTLIEWAKSGIKKVDVICPGFTSDCLETIEEIEVENRDYFLNAGGEQYRYIPALNDRADFIETLANICEQHMSGWDVKRSQWSEEAAKVSGSADVDVRAPRN